MLHCRCLLLVMWFLTLVLASTQFVDLPPTHTAYPAIQYLVEHNIVKGYDAEHFMPDKALTRAEALKIALLASDAKLPTENIQTAFTDIPDDYWAKPFVSYAVQQKIVKGYEDNTFRPNQTISRAEGVKILFSAFKVVPPATQMAVFSDVKTDDWFFPYAGYLAQHHLWSTQHPLFNPGQALTRADLATLAYQLILRNQALHTPFLPLWAACLLILLWALTVYISLPWWHVLLRKNKQLALVCAILTGPLSSMAYGVIQLIPRITVYDHASGTEDSHLNPIKALLTPRKIGLELYQYLVVKSPSILQASAVFAINLLLIHILLISYYSYFYRFAFTY